MYETINDIPESEKIPNQTRIEKYVEKVLDEADRIKEPMNENSDVSVVVPMRGERKNVLKLLDSFLKQKEVNEDEFEIICLINNNQKDLEEQNEYYIENQKTIKIFELLKNEKFQIVKDGTNSLTISFGDTEITATNYKPTKIQGINFSYEELDIIHNIKKSSLNYHYIDKSSNGRLLKTQNVGAARNLGVAAAASRFLDIKNANGIIAQTDGDAIVDPLYIKNLKKEFNDPNLVGLTGKMRFRPPEFDDVMTEPIYKKAVIYAKINTLFNRLYQLVATDHTETLAHFYGGNMACRVTACWIGVPEIPGREDRIFGQRLQMIGKTKVSKDTITYPEDRVSNRTSADASFGWRKINYAEKVAKEEEIDEENPEYHIKTIEIDRRISSIFKEIERDHSRDEHISTYFQRLKNINISNKFGPFLNQNELLTLIPELYNSIHSNQEKNFISDKALTIIHNAKIRMKKKFKPIPLFKTSWKLIETLQYDHFKKHPELKIIFDDLLRNIKRLKDVEPVGIELRALELKALVATMEHTMESINLE